MMIHEQKLIVIPYDKMLKLEVPQMAERTGLLKSMSLKRSRLMELTIVDCYRIILISFCLVSVASFDQGAECVAQST